MSGWSAWSGARFLLAVGMIVSLFVLPEVSGAVPPPAAPDGSSEEEQLLKEETVVSASRYEQPISKAPSNVYVITDEDIKQSGATDIPTVLRRVPGMEVMQTTAAEYNVSMRGDNQLVANKLLVLVDGRSIYVDAQGIVFWKNIPVTLPEIKRIEVIKGPASAVYGFNAFDGVINIITKSPEEMKGTTLQVSGGQYGTWMNSAIQAGTHGKFGYRLSVGEDQAQQWNNRQALAFRSYKFNLHTTYALPGDSSLAVSGGLVDANRFDGPLGQINNSNTTPSQGYAYVSYTRPNSFLRAFWTGNYIGTNSITFPALANFLTATDAAGSPSFFTTTNTYNVEGQHTLELGASNRFSFGVNYRRNTISGAFTQGFHYENRLGVYVQDEWKLTQAFTANAGVRWDFDTFIHQQFSPRVTLLYTLAPEHTLRANVSVGYRPPTLEETYFAVQNFVTVPTPGGPFTTTFPTFGSVNLNPEEIVSYDLGYQGWFFRHRVRARADLFFNHLSNLINFLPTGSAPTAPVVATNGPNADIYGGEAGVDYQVTTWLSGFANVAYQEVGQTFRGFIQRGAPHIKVNVGVRGEWDKLSGEAGLFHYGATTYPLASAFTSFAPFGVMVPNPTVPSYTLLNLRLGYRLWQDKAEVAVSAFNALNDRHLEYPLGNVIGTRVMGWFTLKF